MLKHVFFYFIGSIIACSFVGCEGNNETDTDTEIVTSGEEKVSKNGFKYIHHIKNEGPKPQPGEYVYYDVELYGINDSLSQSFFLEAGHEFKKILPLEQTKGFTNPIVDVLYFMAVGDSLTVKVAPGSIESLQPGYDDFSYLNFQIILTAIKSPAEHSKLQIEKFNKRKGKLIEAQANLEKLTSFFKTVLSDYKAGTIENLIETKSGLKYVIHEEGKGKTLRRGNTVNLFYAGLLMDGTIFENTFESGAGTSIQVGRGQTLPGWDEAMTYLKLGTKVSLFIPYQLAYGEAGNANVPPKADVMYYMELME